MRYPVHLRQFVFFFKRIVLHQKLVAAGFDVAEVLVQVDALVFHVEQAACDVRAVVSHTFQICQQVGQHKACGQRTFAALEPGNVICAQFILQLSMTCSSGSTCRASVRSSCKNARLVRSTISLTAFSIV